MWKTVRSFVLRVSTVDWLDIFLILIGFLSLLMLFLTLLFLSEVWATR